MEKPIIVGIDPGTTTAYAILNIEGKVLETYSGKDLGISKLISRISEFGIPILVGGDKAKCSELIARFSTKTGAKLIIPNHDLKILEKKLLIGNRKLDAHQSDALASAIFSYKQNESLIRKVKKHLMMHEKENIVPEIITSVVKYGVSINDALSIYNEPEEKHNEVYVESVKKINNEDFDKLLTKFKRLGKENTLIISYNNKLLFEIKKLSQIVRNHKKKIYQKDKLSYSKINSLMKLKEDRFKINNRKISDLNEIIRLQGEKLKNYEYYLRQIDNYYVMPLFRSLNSKSLDENSSEKIFVEDPNIINLKYLDKLKKHVNLIVYTKKLSKKLSIGINLVHVEKEEYKLIGNLVFIKKNIMDPKINNKEKFYNIIEEYQSKKTKTNY